MKILSERFSLGLLHLPKRSSSTNRLRFRCGGGAYLTIGINTTEFGIISYEKDKDIPRIVANHLVLPGKFFGLRNQ